MPLDPYSPRRTAPQGVLALNHPARTAAVSVSLLLLASCGPLPPSPTQHPQASAAVYPTQKSTSPASIGAAPDTTPALRPPGLFTPTPTTAAPPTRPGFPSHEPIAAANLSRVVRQATLGRARATQIALSPDGVLLAVASPIGIYLYQVSTLDLSAFLPVDGGAIGISFSPDGEVIATTSSRGTVALRRVADGTILRTLEGDTGYPAGTCLFTPDARYLISNSIDGAVRLWRVEDGRLMATFRGDAEVGMDYMGRERAGTTDLAVSRDAVLLATVDRTVGVRVYDVASGGLLRAIDGSCVAFSPAAALLAVCLSGNDALSEAIQVWDVNSWSLAETIPISPAKVTSIGFSADGANLILAAETFIRVIGLESHWATTSIAAASRDWFASASLSADDQFLATLSYNGLVTLHRLGVPEMQDELPQHVDSVSDLVFSPDETLLASVDEAAVRLWSLADSTLYRVFPFPEARHVAFSPDGALLAAGSFLSGIRVWRLVDGELVQTLTDVGAVEGLGFSPTGTSLAATDGHGLHLWGVPGWGSLAESPGSLLGTIEFSPAGDLLALGSYTTVHLVTVPALAPAGTLSPASYVVSDIVFTPDGRLLTTGDFNTQVWNLTDHEQVTAIPRPGSVISPRADIFAIGSWDQVQLCTIPQGNCEVELDTAASPVSAIAFSPSAALMAVAGTNGVVEVWATGQ